MIAKHKNYLLKKADRKTVKTLFAVATVLVSGAYADIAPNPMYSRGIEAFNETRVQMVDEVVTVDLYKDYAMVTAAFNMKNHGDETTLEVGFPDIVGNFMSSLTDFTVTVDGEERSYTVRVNNEVKEYPPGETPESWDPEADIKWLLWDEMFQKNERKKIVVSYIQPYGAVYSSGLFGERYFRYILETGAGWYDVIEQATVIVNLKDGLTPEHIIVARPDEYTLAENRLQWELRNLEPTRKNNIFVLYNRFAEYSEIAEEHKNLDTDDWREAWALAYASNKAGQYELAAKWAQKGLSIPFRKLSRWNDDNKEMDNYRQLAFYKQLVLSKYRIYLKDNSTANLANLQEVQNRLKETALMVSNAPPAVINQLFGSHDYTDIANEWWLTDYIMDDETIVNYKRGVSIFRKRWNKHIEVARKNCGRVQLLKHIVHVELYRHHSKVQAVFHLQNQSKETVVEIDLYDLVGNADSTDTFTQVALSVDGQNLELPSHPETNPAYSDAEKTFGYRNRWNPSWKIPFKEQEAKVITLTYTMPERSFRDDLKQAARYRYDLGNDSLWYGPIQHAMVTIELKGLTTEHLEHPELIQSHISGNKLVWEYNDWKPNPAFMYMESVGDIEFFYNLFKDYEDYVAYHHDKPIDKWEDAWKLAYAYHQTGQFELAAKIAEQGLAMPYESSLEDDGGRMISSPDGNHDSQYRQFKQLALCHQQVMARYQLYLADKSAGNIRMVKEALADMRSWAEQVVKNPQNLETIFPDDDFDKSPNKWILTKNLIDDNSVYGDRIPGRYKRAWQGRIGQEPEHQR